MGADEWHRLVIAGPAPAVDPARLPTLIVIGAQRCGTTSVHYYLGLHPEITMSAGKELDFFIEERNWPRGLDWYQSQFATGTAHRGESSPNYTAHPHFAGVPERMHAIVPGARLVYLVRDPIERLLSEYVRRVAARTEIRTLEEVVLEAGDDPRYVSRGLYAMQLERYLELYDLSQILVVPTEDLRERRGAALRQVFRFLGVDESVSRARFAVRRNSSAVQRLRSPTGDRVARVAHGRLTSRMAPDQRATLERIVSLPFSRRVERPRLPEALRARLLEAFREDAARLRELTGLELATWSV